jgi:phage-related protein
MEVEVLYKGRQFTLYGIRNDGKSLVQEFLDGIDQKNRAQMMALINHIKEHGPPHNELKFRSLGDEIYELKTRGGSRILCFWGRPQNSLVLTHGFPKCKRQRLRTEKRRALLWYKQYQTS